jgi:HK97 family phage portal protein
MGLLAPLSRSARAEFKAVDASDLTWTALLGQPASKAGVAVNIETALRASTVFACCRVLGEGVAQLPLNLFEIIGNSKKLATNNPLFNILALRPNDFMTSFEFRETMMYHAVLTSNAFAYIGRGGIGKTIQELIPIYSPVRIDRDKNWNITYWIEGPDGESVPFTQQEIFHLRGPSWNGYVGMDAVKLARESIGLAIATEETHARLFANGAKPGGVLSVEGTLGKENREALKARIAEMQEGLHNNFKTLVLDQNAKWMTMAMTGVDSQHLETRRFQTEEVCRALRVFPQMVMSSDKVSTFASAEQFFIAHVTHSLMPWVKRWEEKIGHSLLGAADNLEAKFATAAIMFGDAAARSTYYQNALGGARGETAYLTRNEVRSIESALLGISFDPLEGGDDLPTATPPAAPIGGPDVTPHKPALPAAPVVPAVPAKPGTAQ